jgi:gas vesicle protein
MNNKVLFFVLSTFLISSAKVKNVEAINLNQIVREVSTNQTTGKKSSLDVSTMLDDAVKNAVKTGTDELNKNVKSIVDDVRGDVKNVISDAKKDLNSVVDDAKKEISSIQGTIKEVKNTIYSIKASFDKIIILLKVLIGLVGVLITLLCFSFLNKIIKILKLTKSVVNIAKGKAEK